MSILTDKLTKVNESFTINMYDNGYMIEVGGRNEDDDWKTAKVMVTTVDELLEIVREVTDMTRAD
jgi:ketol-acid reductoisomerase